jgi:hypothetical protein
VSGKEKNNWCGDDEGWRWLVRIAGGINGLRDMIARVRNNDSLSGYICRNDEKMLEENDNNTSGLALLAFLFVLVFLFLNSHTLRQELHDDASSTSIQHEWMLI